MKSRIAVASLVTVVALAALIGSAAMTPSSVLASPTVQQTVAPEDVAREVERNVLQINNNTPFINIMYIGGIRIGWMRPYHTGFIRGLLVGYHRLYSHSQYGTTSWGPRDIWIPGTWNLLY